MSLPEENTPSTPTTEPGSTSPAAANSHQDGGLQIRAVIAPQVNFACQQNAVPVIRDIDIINKSDRSLYDLTLQMSASPGFIDARTWTISQLRPGDLLQISDRDTRLNGQFLLGLRERQQGEIIFHLKDNKGNILATEHHPIEVLARNEWGGFGTSPTLLAAFSMPNEPAVDQLLRTASDILRTHGEDGTMLQYDKATPQRIWLQASAIWSAIAALKLDYTYPPKSFESTGQKIRTPGEILQARRATCLDTTMLVASVLEQAGLHPLVILDQGHAYVGVWLKEEGFSQAYAEDLLALRKRVQLHEICVFETTLLCQGASFATAVRSAEEHLREAEDDFIGVLDIARARDQRIHPLSFVDESTQIAENAAEPTLTTATALELPPDDEFDNVITDWETADTGPAGRLGQWQRRLLDLTLRNPLLKMRNTKTNLRLVAPDPGRLEDLIAQGKKFSIVAAPGYGERDPKIHNQRTGTSLDDETALAALSRSTIYVEDDPQRLESALVELYRKARNDLEEGGSNTLFLAIGVLYWQRQGSRSTSANRAPLILIPVTITRQSVRSGIKISLSDDEPRFNTTLLEMLRQDFALDIHGLNGDLPTDGHGTDIPAILTRMRQEIRDVAGFEVREEVWLGTFSFAKYLMWKDLVDRTDQLKQNPVVKHLIDNPREPFAESTGFIEPGSLDTSVEPDELYTPLDSDSSQLAAIVAAARGKNFVMIGPPGTGKSQTIANMIVHNLGLGRTVLFVSEKAAALNVVYRRLQQHGLGEFCLELHSNKARKLDVIQQLGRAWDARGKLSESEWEDKTSRLRRVRDELNQFVHALHHTHPNGLSVRHALATAAGNDTIPEVKFNWPDPAAHDQPFIERLQAIGERLELNAEQVGDISSHPLRIIHTADWSMAWQEKIVTRAQDLSARATAWRNEIDRFTKSLEIPGTDTSKSRLISLAILAKILIECAGKDLRFAFAPNIADILSQITEARQLLTTFHEKNAALSCPYNRDSALNTSIHQTQQLWQQSLTSWWLPRWLNQRKVRAALVQTFGAAATPNPAVDLPILQEMQNLKHQLDALAPALSAIRGWRGLDSDTALLDEISDLATRLRAAITAIAHTPDELLALRSAVEKLVIGGNELLHPASGTVGTQLATFLRLGSEFQTSLTHFASEASRQPDDLLQSPTALDEIAALGTIITESQNRLNAWCAWRRVRSDAVDAGMTPLVTQVETGAIPLQGIRKVVKVNYCRWWGRQMFDATPTLRNFVSIEHERKIKTFKQLDTEVRKITSDYIRTRIRAGLAQREDVTRSSEFGIIRRELEKKTRHKPLRQLIREAPTAIPTLTPCLLMSPLSIAQYLPADQAPFDVVIFDEASQITVWDAIGALARGKQSIVVGDPKQLPPTSFFNSGYTAEDIDDDLDIVEDLESILDEMLGSNLPTINLAWHYRSRHESLITFSNQRYYDNSLITFPSPVTHDRAVSLEFIGGTYDRGSSQTNRAEADAIINEIKRRLTSPDTAHQTLGVVTFNQKQQTLILNLLEKTRADNPDLDKHFAEDLVEPVFVKNLEAVQGDERDVILFSTTFGPDKTGRISMNFGPLNNSGGERRLNVAITRARTELKVFTSLRPDQIDLSRTAALGVRDLKHFLEFAERGPRALIEAVDGPQGDFESPLESAVARQLRELGWIVQPQIGVSQFRIDLGIIDPDAPGSYLAGIECDGATYHRSATARDRDLVRESVLRGLGWEILRLWSTDYWINPKGVINTLHESLTTLLQQRRDNRAAASQSAQN